MSDHIVSVSRATTSGLASIVLLLLCVSAVSAALIAVEVRSLYRDPARAVEMIDTAKMKSTEEPEDKKYLAGSKECAEALKKANLFVLPAPKQNPVKKVAGILGNEALINGKWYKAGAKVGDARIVAVDATQVKVEWNGQEKVFAPIAAADSGAGGRPARPRGAGRRRSPGRAGMVKVGRPDMPMPPPGAGRRMEMMSSEDRARMRERYMNMSEEEREQFRMRMRGRRSRR